MPAGTGTKGLEGKWAEQFLLFIAEPTQQISAIRRLRGQIQAHTCGFRVSRKEPSIMHTLPPSAAHLYVYLLTHVQGYQFHLESSRGSGVITVSPKSLMKATASSSLWSITTAWLGFISQGTAGTITVPLFVSVISPEPKFSGNYSRPCYVGSKWGQNVKSVSIYLKWIIMNVSLKETKINLKKRITQQLRVSVV